MVMPAVGRPAFFFETKEPLVRCRLCFCLKGKQSQRNLKGPRGVYGRTQQVRGPVCVLRHKAPFFWAQSANFLKMSSDGSILPPPPTGRGPTQGWVGGPPGGLKKKSGKDNCVWPGADSAPVRGEPVIFGPAIADVLGGRSLLPRPLFPPAQPRPHSRPSGAHPPPRPAPTTMQLQSDLHRRQLAELKALPGPPEAPSARGPSPPESARAPAGGAQRRVRAAPAQPQLGGGGSWSWSWSWGWPIGPVAFIS